MLTLTKSQLSHALHLAESIESLEMGKDWIADQQIRVSIGSGRKTARDPLGQGGEVVVSLAAEAIRAEVNARIAAASRELAALGIELAA